MTCQLGNTVTSSVLLMIHAIQVHTWSRNLGFLPTNCFPTLSQCLNCFPTLSQCLNGFVLTTLFLFTQELSYIHSNSGNRSLNPILYKNVGFFLDVKIGALFLYLKKRDSLFQFSKSYCVFLKNNSKSLMIG